MGVADRRTCEVSSVVGTPSSQLGMNQHIWAQEIILCTSVYIYIYIYIRIYAFMYVLVHMRLSMYVNAPRPIYPYLDFFVFGVSGIKFLSANRYHDTVLVSVVSYTRQIPL